MPNPYGDQKRSFNFYYNGVKNYALFFDKPLDKIIAEVKEMCENTQKENKNPNINYSLESYEGLLNYLSQFHTTAEEFYRLFFFEFFEKVREHYKNKTTITPKSFSFFDILKKISYDGPHHIKTKFITQLNRFIKCKYFVKDEEGHYVLDEEGKKIEIKVWDEEEREQAKKWFSDIVKHLPEKLRQQKLGLTFNDYRQRIIDFRLKRDLDLQTQMEDFYFMCDDAQEKNRDKNGDLTLDNVYDVINEILNSYYFGIKKNDVSICNFYYFMCYHFIQRIQALYNMTKTFQDVVIDQNSVKFSFIIDRATLIYVKKDDKKESKKEDEEKEIRRRFTTQAMRFIEHCHKINVEGWDTEDNRKAYTMIKEYNDSH